MNERSAKSDHLGRKAEEVQLFTKRIGRKKRSGGLDPNDRKVDQRVAKAVILCGSKFSIGCDEIIIDRGL